MTNSDTLDYPHEPDDSRRYAQEDPRDYGKPGPPMYGPSYSDEQPPKKKSSKLLFGMLIGCGGMMLLCCGGFFGLSFFVGKMMQQAVVENPQEIRARTEKIATIGIPESFEPQVAIDMNFPIVGDLGGLVVYSDEDNNGTILLADISDKVTSGLSTEDWVATNGKFMVNGVEMNKDNALESKEIKEIKRTIRGEEVVFTIITGNKKDSEVKRIVGKGTFQGKMGRAFIIISGEVEKLPVEEVEKLLNSIE